MTAMNKMFAIGLLSLSLTTGAFAGVKVTSVDLTTSGNNGYVTISLDGRSNDLPDVKVFGKVIEITISNSEGFNSIFKNVKGAQLSANSLNGKAVIKAMLPYEVEASAVDLGWKNSNIEVIFPRGKVLKAEKTAETAPAKEVVQPIRPITPAADRKVQTGANLEAKISKELLNEDYLNKLMKDEAVVKAAAAPAPEIKADTVSIKQASIVKAPVAASIANAVPKAAQSSDNFSFAGYAAKFSVFLAVVLGLFYGVVQLLKKGVFNKGKLGFLNNTKMIEVLSTTYIAPKRSLLIVKAHKQIFLVANSESGLTFLSEMTDTTGLIKEGEKFVTGTNFDINLGTMENTSESEAIIKLKENIMESTPVNEEKGLSKIAVAKDIVKFSDELKKKAKKLKPIEFN
jgi:flagellar biogenesis protein FliO